MDHAATAAGTETTGVLRAGPVFIDLLTLLGFAVALLMLALGGAMLAGAREDVRREAEQSSTNLALALERDIARNIASLDLSVQGAIEAVKLPGIDGVSREIRHTALFDRAATAEYLGSILVLDGGGRVIDSSVEGGKGLELGDRDYFQAHRERGAGGMYLSKPFSSRLREGDMSIAVSRRIDGPGGAFDGVVMGALRLAYFHHLFETLELGPKGLVSLTRLDGVVVARRPHSPEYTGRDVSRSAVFQRIKTQPTGSFVDRSIIDGEERLYAVRRIGDLPLVVAVGLATEDIYAVWWRKALVIGSVLLALSMAMAALCVLFRHEMVRRLGAQQALQEAAERLRVMASTDSLTGLANRRSFEEVLDQEWRRGLRQGVEISLLMMDADHFKAYNDLYGHPAGDRALQRLAEAIRSSVRRPTDLAARIGGEEFVLLLPATELSGAVMLAERVRAAVHELAIPHAGSALGRMTLCIGVAALRPEVGSEPSRLMKLADDAMYRAKAAGRDRVMVGGEDAVLEAAVGVEGGGAG